MGNLLNKLGQKGREAAAAKALNATPSGSLVRRRSDGGGDATDNRNPPSWSAQGSVPRPDVAASDSENSHPSSVACSEERRHDYRASAEESAGKPAPGGCFGTERHDSTESCSTKSLVADYSDSDSDSAQETA